MARLLVVHHVPSPTLQQLADAVLDGTRAEGLEAVEVTVRPALEARPDDVMACDGIVLGTPANIGYMSGALKHFFDQAYNPCLGATDRLPHGLWIHGNTDTTGARRAVEAITTGLSWRAVADVVESIGTIEQDDLDACWNLGATVAAAALERAG